MSDNELCAVAIVHAYDTSYVGQELVGFVRMRADYHTGVGSRSQWAKDLFPNDDHGVNFAQAFGGGG